MTEIEVDTQKCVGNRMEWELDFQDTMSVINSDGSIKICVQKKDTQTSIPSSRVTTYWKTRE